MFLHVADISEAKHSKMIIIPSYKLNQETTHLYECDGLVYAITDFVKKYIHLLDPIEQDFIQSNMEGLSKFHDIPSALQRPLTRSDYYGLKFANIEAVVSGQRSALLPQLKIKIKGCIPMEGHKTFPMLYLPFGGSTIKRENIPFGIMNAEAVIREVLGYCFMTTYKLGVVCKPLAVYEYKNENQTIGFALSLKIRSDQRLTSYLDYQDVHLRDLIHYKKMGDCCDAPITSEVRFKGINMWKYLEAKSRILCEMHFNGGFRGILNSNLSNDIVLTETGESYFISDFDSFHFIDISYPLDNTFYESFAVAALIEVVMGSLPILDYIEIGQAVSYDHVARILAQQYQKTSSSWRFYWNKVEVACKKYGWDLKCLRDAFAKAFATPVFIELLRFCLLNSKMILPFDEHIPQSSVMSLKG